MNTSPSENGNDWPATKVYVPVTLDASGMLAIPAGLLQSVGFEPGQDLLLIPEDGDLRITTFRKRAEKAQALVRKYARRDGSAVEELIADRRLETEHPEQQ